MYDLCIRYGHTLKHDHTKIACLFRLNSSESVHDWAAVCTVIYVHIALVNIQFIIIKISTVYLIDTGVCNFESFEFCAVGVDCVCRLWNGTAVKI